MPDITITVPPQALARLRTAVQNRRALENLPDEAYIAQMIKDYLRELVISEEADEAERNARRNVPDPGI